MYGFYNREVLDTRSNIKSIAGNTKIIGSVFENINIIGHAGHTGTVGSGSEFSDGIKIKSLSVSFGGITQSLQFRDINGSVFYFSSGQTVYSITKANNVEPVDPLSSFSIKIGTHEIDTYSSRSAKDNNTMINTKGVNIVAALPYTVSSNNTPITVDVTDGFTGSIYFDVYYR